jgi:hypothetical protein
VCAVRAAGALGASREQQRRRRGSDKTFHDEPP